MIITKMSLPRRTFLRGIGATVALPFLDAMRPALSATTKGAVEPVQRLGFVYIPNGAFHEAWTPKTEGTNFELSPTLKPLERFRDSVVVVSNLAHRQLESLGDGGGDHSRSSAGWLSGVHAKRTEGADVHVGTTADQIAAKIIGQTTPLSSLEIALDASDIVGHCDAGYSCSYINSVSWRTPTTPNPMERNPRVVLERLFGDGDSAAERVREMQTDRSLLDSVTQDVGRLQRTLGAQDRNRVTEYLDAIRETERRIQKTEEYNSSQDLTVPERPVSIPEDFQTHAKIMIDLQVLAYQADLTRVSTFAFGREATYRTFPAIGVFDGHHALSHHQNDAQKLAKLAKVNQYQVETFAYYLERLQAAPDGDGNLLEHTLLLYGSGMSDGNLHNHSPLPLVLAGGAGGRLKGNRHLRCPPETPMTNLLVSMLGMVGVPIERLGDSTGPLAGIERATPLSSL